VLPTDIPDIDKDLMLEMLMRRDGGPIRRQIGGPIPGYGGGDIIPVLAEGGEYIVRKEAARYARPVLDAINSGRIKGYSRGGSVDPVYAVTGDSFEDEFNRIHVKSGMLSVSKQNVLWYRRYNRNPTFVLQQYPALSGAKR